MKNINSLNDAMYNATNDCSIADYKPENSITNGETYAQGVVVGLVSGLMCTGLFPRCGLVHRLPMLRTAPISPQ